MTATLTPGQLALARAMTEAQLDEAINARAAIWRPRGLLAAHFRPARITERKTVRETYRTAGLGDVRGYPDWTLVGPGGIEWWECKRAQGARLTPGQPEWRDAILTAGGTWRLVTPIDLHAGRVDTWLANLAQARSTP